MPGPLFNFAAYLGTIIAINANYVFIIGTVIAWFGLFLPGGGGCMGGQRLRGGARLRGRRSACSRRRPAGADGPACHARAVRVLAAESGWLVIDCRHHDHFWRHAVLGHLPEVGTVQVSSTPSATGNCSEGTGGRGAGAGTACKCVAWLPGARLRCCSCSSSSCRLRAQPVTPAAATAVETAPGHQR